MGCDPLSFKGETVHLFSHYDLIMKRDPLFLVYLLHYPTEGHRTKFVLCFLWGGMQRSCIKLIRLLFGVLRFLNKVCFCFNQANQYVFANRAGEMS